MPLNAHQTSLNNSQQ